MTTIAYRNGTMACDSRGYTGGKSPIGSKCKIERLEDGTLLGASSTVPGGGEQIRKWYKDGCPKDVDYNLPDKFTMLAVKASGEAFYADDNLMLSGPLTADYFAIGSGLDFALGAMAAGQSAIMAVNIACELDVWSEGPVFSLTHFEKHGDA